MVLTGDINSVHCELSHKNVDASNYFLKNETL